MVIHTLLKTLFRKIFMVSSAEKRLCTFTESHHHITTIYNSKEAKNLIAKSVFAYNLSGSINLIVKCSFLVRWQRLYKIYICVKQFSFKVLWFWVSESYSLPWLTHLNQNKFKWKTRYEYAIYFPRCLGHMFLLLHDEM